MPGLRLTGPDEVIDIRVLAVPSEDLVVFKMRKRMQLQRLIDAFHAHRRQRAGSYIFLYNSREVNAADTPESLRMSRNDVVIAAPNPAHAQDIGVRRVTGSQSFYITVSILTCSQPALSCFTPLLTNVNLFYCRYAKQLWRKGYG